MIQRASHVLITAVVLAATAAIPLLSQTSAPAHRRFEIAPALGAYVPSGGVPQTFSVGCYSDPCWLTEFPSFREARTVAAGGRVTAWLAKRWGMEGSGWYAPSHATDVTRYTTEPFVAYTGGGGVALLSLRAVFDVATPSPIISVLLTAGPAVIHRLGDGWSAWKNPTSTGGAVGIGLAIHPAHRVGLRVAIEDYAYRFDSTDPQVIPSEFHHDFVFSLSIGPSLGRR